MQREQNSEIVQSLRDQYQDTQFGIERLRGRRGGPNAKALAILEDRLHSLSNDLTAAGGSLPDQSNQTQTNSLPYSNSSNAQR